MKVFVFIKTHQFDYGSVGLITRVYDTFEKAQTVFKAEMKQAIRDFKNLGKKAEQDNYSEGDMEWSIWEKDEYLYNHIDLTIVEREVE